MKLVNVTDRNVYNSSTGNVAPGRTTPDTFRDLEKVLQKVVDICGRKFGIILNEREAALVERLMALDELGEKFDVMSIPASIRNDPTGAKKASEMTRKSQQASIDADKKANEEAERREAIINGEIDERAQRKPVGPATMEGEKVDPKNIKSGFEAILEENARIAAGKKNEHASTQEMLDPIGAHMKKGGSQDPEPAQNDGTGIGDAQPVKQARNLDGDAVRTADANVPAPEVSERASAMDRQASDIARKLSTIGPEAPSDPAYKPPVDAGLEILPKPGNEPLAEPVNEPASELIAEPVNEPARELAGQDLKDPDNGEEELEKPGKPAKAKGKKSVKKGKGKKGA